MLVYLRLVHVSSYSQGFNLLHVLIILRSRIQGSLQSVILNCKKQILAIAAPLFLKSNTQAPVAHKIVIPPFWREDGGLEEGDIEMHLLLQDSFI